MPKSCASLLSHDRKYAHNLRRIKAKELARILAGFLFAQKCSVGSVCGLRVGMFLEAPDSIGFNLGAF
jgi:hypothetical protein